MTSAVFWRPRRLGARAAETAPEAAANHPLPDFTTAMLAELPRLRRYAIALVGDAARADDLLHDCIERALRDKAELLHPQRIYGWLRTIVHNLHIDELRRTRRNSMVNWDDLPESEALSVPPANRDQAVDMARAMGGLSEDHRRILLMIGVDGMSYRDIGQELGVPVGTVMSRLARARAQLRLKLESLEPATAAGRQDSTGKSVS